MGPVMSKGMIDIVLYEIDQTEETIRGFADDPAAWLSGFRLTEDERSAFERWDYGTLYALGAHPFLLWQTVRSLSMLEDTPIPEILDEYRKQVEAHGWPDHIT